MTTTRFSSATRLQPSRSLGAGYLLGMPASVIWAAVIAVLAFLLLRFTKIGRFIYAMGDNPLAARVAGIPVRSMIVLQYTISAHDCLCRWAAADRDCQQHEHALRQHRR